MIRANRRSAGGGGDPALSVRLGYDDRHRRRFAITTSSGERVLIDLEEAEQLRDGDTLELEDGRALRIEAEAEAVADIETDDPLALTRIAWHLGNRHTATAVLPGRLRIRRDHVLETMVLRLGGRVHATAAPFDPEVGAYHPDAAHGEVRAHHRVAAVGDGAGAVGGGRLDTVAPATLSNADEREE